MKCKVTVMKMYEESFLDDRESVGLNDGDEILLMMIGSLVKN